jgi:hypothetical protein
MNPEVILKRFTLATKNEPESSIPKQLTEKSLWKEIQTVSEGAVKDTSSKEAKSLSVTFHILQVNQELKDYQIAGLESALKSERSRKRRVLSWTFNSARSIMGVQCFINQER